MGLGMTDAFFAIFGMTRMDGKTMTRREVVQLLQLNKDAVNNLVKAGVLLRHGKSKYDYSSVMQEYERRVKDGRIVPE